MGSSFSTDAPSASTWRQKIKEASENFYRPISLLLSAIITKIKDAGDALLSAIRSIEVDLLKEALGICYDWLTWFLGSIVALKLTNGEAFFYENYSVMMALFLTRFASFMTMLLAMLIQMRIRNIAPLTLMIILFDSGASFLALSLISKPVLWVSLSSWLCVVVFFGYNFYPELKEKILQIKTWVANHNPVGSPSSTVFFCKMR